MLRWPDVLNLAKNGNATPDRKVVKTDAEWRQQLSPEEYHVTRQAGTERPFSSEMCSLFEPGIYACLCCETVNIRRTRVEEAVGQRGQLRGENVTALRPGAFVVAEFLQELPRNIERGG